ncbi:MAG: hypothetical protein H7A09_02015 [Oceanospirillaceae bacterium]|nr:hypothetical protein [Oceanospirillaceae bacterium]MCP5334537.1 hypothetical protein [Oceanospirillaceae bacterium]
MEVNHSFIRHERKGNSGLTIAFSPLGMSAGKFAFSKALKLLDGCFDVKNCANARLEAESVYSPSISVATANKLRECFIRKSVKLELFESFDFPVDGRELSAIYSVFARIDTGDIGDRFMEDGLLRMSRAALLKRKFERSGEGMEHLLMSLDESFSERYLRSTKPVPDKVH